MIIAVIPAYNEEKHIGDVIKKTKKFVDRVIVVDDCSSDKTFEIAKVSADIVIKNPINMGKGFSLRTGIEEAMKEKAKIIVMLDADGQHDPSEIPKLVAVLKEREMVVGKREFGSKMPIGSRVANIFFSSLFRILFNFDAGDILSGFRAIRAGSYRKIMWKSNRYAVETEMLAKAAKNKLSYAAVPIKTIYHEVYKGTSVIDAIKIFFYLLWFRIAI